MLAATQIRPKLIKIFSSSCWLSYAYIRMKYSSVWYMTGVLSFIHRRVFKTKSGKCIHHILLDVKFFASHLLIAKIREAQHRNLLAHGLLKRRDTTDEVVQFETVLDLHVFLGKVASVGGPCEVLHYL